MDNDRPASSPSGAGDQANESDAHGTHIESVVVDSIDGHFVMPAEVEDGPGEENHILVQDITGLPVAEPAGAAGEPTHTEPVVVDTIDGQFAVPATAEDGSSEAGHVPH